MNNYTEYVIKYTGDPKMLNEAFNKIDGISLVEYEKTGGFVKSDFNHYIMRIYNHVVYKKSDLEGLGVVIARMIPPEQSTIEDDAIIATASHEANGAYSPASVDVLKLSILLWYYSNIDDYPNLDDPTVMGAVHSLCNAGILSINDGSSKTDKRISYSQDALDTYFNEILSIPLPTRVWCVLKTNTNEKPNRNL